MRVIHVIDSLAASGGAEHGLVREISGFSPDLDQLVVRMFERDQLEAQLLAQGIPVHPLGLSARRAGWNWLLGVWRLRKVVRELHPDVIHSSLFTANLVAQLVGRLTGTPVVSTFTLSGDRDLLRRFQPGASSWRGSALRWLAARCARSNLVWFRALTKDALVTNCELLGVDPGRARVIPRGIPEHLRASQVRPRREIGLPDRRRILLNVGRQTAQKGQDLLVESFSQVVVKIPAHLVIVGREAEASASLRDLIREKGLQESVTIAGYTPDVPSFYAHASVFVFTSQMEGLGTAVLEALAWDLPVVAFDIPPVREATDDGRLARLVPVRDVEALTAAVLETLEADPAESTARSDWVAQNRSIDLIASKVESLIREVVSLSRAR